MKLQKTMWTSAILLVAFACGTSLNHSSKVEATSAERIQFAHAHEDQTANGIVRFTGDGYERGFAHGVHFKPQIQEIMNDVLGEHFRNFLIRWYALYHAKNMMANLPEDYIQEMQGIADGAEVDFNNVLLGNLVVDLAQVLSKGFACSSFVVMPGRSASGYMLTGRDLDWNTNIAESMQRFVQPMIFAAPGKHEVLSIGFPGMAGVLTGINDQGVSLSVMYSYHDDISQSGYPIAFLYRKVLEQTESFDSAKRLFYRTEPRTIAANTMLTDGTHAAILETTSTLAASRGPSERGIVYSANHFETSKMIGSDEPGRDERWDVLSKWETIVGQMSMRDVRDTMAESAMNDDSYQNVKAVFVDYGRNVLSYAHTGQPAAAHEMEEIDLGQAFANQVSPIPGH